MTIEQWNELSPDTKEQLMIAVFNNQYLSMRAARDPEKDVLIQEVLKVTSLNGNMAYINIHKKVKIR